MCHVKCALVFVLLCSLRNIVSLEEQYNSSDIFPLSNINNFTHLIDNDLNFTRESRRSHFDETENCLHRKESQQGLCYGEVTCKRLRGKVTGFCPGLRGACCVFYRTCGGRTAQTISYFRNENWPMDERLKETCSFSISKKDSSICGLSIQLKKLKLPGKVGKCYDTYLWITGVPGRRFELICGEYSGVSYHFNITKTSEVFLKLKSYSGYKTSWSFTVKQISCDEFRTEVIPMKGDGEFPFLTPIVDTPKPGAYIPQYTTTAAYTTVTTTTTTTTTTSRPIEYSQCGVKGYSTSVQKTKQGPRKTVEDALTLVRNNTAISQEEEDELYSEDQDEFDDRSTSKIEWKVPELTDTLFFKFIGEPTILDQRITYGAITDVGEFPWQAALFIGKSFHCGGSIISEEFILTAAHCVVVHKNSPQQLRIILGVWNIVDSDKEGAETYRVDRVTVHPDYSRRTLQNDIAIIKLKRKITYNMNIRPVCLPPKDVSLTGKLATITGWGRDQRKRLVTRLHKLQAAIVSNTACDERWVSSGAQKGFIVSSMMCMDAQDGDSCNGDSGGPSVIEDPNVPGQFMQVGIVSFGSGSCTQKSLPGVYTKVNMYMDWINKNMV